jgi:farnesyl-diphosphate farnesyltransferase
MASARSADPDLAWCHEAVRGVSRTFAVTVDVLEEPMSSHVCVGYLLCRVADTVEDAGHVPPGAQAALLHTYRDAIDESDETTMAEFRADVDEWLPPPAERSDDWAVVAEAPTVWATFADLPGDVRDAITPPVREMVGGMARFVDHYADAGGLRIGDRAELDRYCHYAAGTVGTLVTNLLTRDGVTAARSRTLYGTAASFGLLLQLINVSKDVHSDYTEENNVYLPAEWLAAEDVAQEAVLEPQNRPAATRVVRRTASYAETFLEDAQRYVESMPLAHGNTLAAWAVPLLLGVGTLRELADRPGDALTATGVSVDREEVFAVMGAVDGADPGAVADLRERIARRPLHEST